MHLDDSLKVNKMCRCHYILVFIKLHKSPHWSANNILDDQLALVCDTPWSALFAVV